MFNDASAVLVNYLESYWEVDVRFYCLVERSLGEDKIEFRYIPDVGDFEVITSKPNH